MAFPHAEHDLELMKSEIRIMKEGSRLKDTYVATRLVGGEFEEKGGGFEFDEDSEWEVVSEWPEEDGSLDCAGVLGRLAEEWKGGDGLGEEERS